MNETEQPKKPRRFPFPRLIRTMLLCMGGAILLLYLYLFITR